MLTRLSWTDYLVTVAILLFLYYAIVLTLFYKQDILFLVTGRNNRFSNVQAASVQNETIPEVIEPLAGEVKALILQSAYNNKEEEEIRASLKKLMSAERFQAVKETGNHSKLNEVITREIETYCSMHLSEEDLESLWRGM